MVFMTNAHLAIRDFSDSNSFNKNHFSFASMLQKQKNYTERLDNAGRLLSRLGTHSANKRVQMTELESRCNQLQTDYAAISSEYDLKNDYVLDLEEQLVKLKGDIVALREELEEKGRDHGVLYTIDGEYI